MLVRLLQKGDLWVISFAANLMSLALPIYVIQALSRYLASGIDATLYALTAGVLVSIGAEFLLRQYRRQAVLLMLRQDNASPSFFDEIRKINLAHPALGAFSNLPSRLQRIRKHRTHQNIDSVLSLYDIPFAGLFIILIYLISPIAFVIFAVFSLAGASLALIFMASEQRIRSKISAQQYLVDYAETELLSPAYAQASLPLQKGWLAQFQKNDTELNEQRLRLASNQHNQRLVNMILSNMLSVFVIFSSVLLVFRGELEIGALIALNILIGKSFMQLMQFPAVIRLFRSARNSQELGVLANLAGQASGKSSINEFAGNIELRQIAFQHPAKPANAPALPISHLFHAGTTTVITGANGSGKSSLYNVICGTHPPQSGSVLVDGVDRQQLSDEWWRAQIGCLSQDPQFLDETLYNTFQANGADDELISNAIFRAGLKPLIDNLPSGVHTSLSDSRLSSLKIRKQLALAHLLCRAGQLIVMDEPTAGLDSQTALIFYNLMNQMIAQKRTLIIFSTDPVVLKGADIVITIGTAQGIKISKKQPQASQNPPAASSDKPASSSPAKTEKKGKQ